MFVPQHSSGRLAVRVCAVCVAAALLSGCSGSPDTPPPETATAATVAASPPKTTLVDSGTGSKQLLQFTGAEVTQKLEAEITAGFTQAVVPAGSVTTTPVIPGDTTTMLLGLEGGLHPIDGEDLAAAATTAADGTALPSPTGRTDFTVTSIDYSDPEATDDMATAQGFVFGADTDARGRIYRWRLRAPDGSTTASRALVENKLLAMASIPVVLPDEPVGKDAVWTTSAPLPGDTSMMQTVTYRLVDITETAAGAPQVQLDVSVDRHPALREISGGSGETITGLSVLDTATTTSGRLTVDFSRPLPVDGKVTVTTRVIYGKPETTPATDGPKQPENSGDSAASPDTTDNWVVQDTTYTIGFTGR